MRIKVNSKTNSKFVKRVFLLFRRINKLFRLEIVVQGGAKQYKFFPKCKDELFRCLTFFTKEEGTIAWLKSNIKEGDVFIDIGANVGIYSIYAAKISDKVKVYSFEPHKPTFLTLLDNVVDNDLLATVSPVAIALGNSNDVIKLNYYSLSSGSSNSQLGHSRSLLHNKNFLSKFEEIVPSVTLDELVNKNLIDEPTVIKIDVDGNEMLILEGMKGILSSSKRPKSVQVELNIGEQDKIIEWMKMQGYALQSKHYTADGKISLQKGMKEDKIAYNAIFVPSV